MGLSIEKYTKDSWDYSLLPNTLNSNVKYKFICKVCNKIIEETPTNHLRKHRRTKEFPGCQECHLEGFNLARREKNKLNFIRKAKNLFGPNTYLFEDDLNYKSQRDIVIITKPNGEKFSVRAESFLRGKTDDNKRSILEKITISWLTNNEIEFKEQFKLNDLKTTSVKFIRVDFFVQFKNTTFIIETNGKQHYSLDSMLLITNKSRDKNSKERFKSQIKRDQDLRAYCKDNGIILIEIPYTYDTYSKIDTILSRIILSGDRNIEEIIIQPKIESDNL